MSSQQTREDNNNNLVGRSSSASSSTVNSSPQRPSSSANAKERRNPSITPRKFRRFFTPRPLPSNDSIQSASLKLRALGTGAQRKAFSSPIDFTSWSDENTPPALPRGLKRQKLSHSTSSDPKQSVFHAEPKDLDFNLAQHLETRNEEHGDPIPSSPCPRDRRIASDQNIISNYDVVEDDEPSILVGGNGKAKPVPIRRANRHGGLSTQLYEMELGRVGRPGRLHHRYPVNDWRDLTANFYSRPEDTHEVMSLNDESRRTIPFVAVGLNNSSLLAVGDEEGRIRLLESAKGGKPSFQEKYLGFCVHTNAIIDMTFSDDDSLLATASGDQSARVVDMGTQTTIAVLGVHNASLKQVRFQSGSNNKNILATSGRDGSIQIWDLRCKGWDGPQSRIWTAIDGNLNGGRAAFSDQDVLYSRPSNSIMDAHRPIAGQPQPSTAGWSDAPSRGEAISRLEDLGRSTDISVTSLQFLHHGREHLLLSACEANSSVKLWDIRALPSKRSTLPLSATALPPSHYGYRNYGITSLNLNSNGSTFYAVCKDNVVYAYRTSHLILGQAPELDTPATSRMPPVRPTQEGQGPVYGLVNKKFHANTFYVKSALRTTKNGHTELLAVGSTDECAVLFPTDERYLPSPSLANGTISAKQKEFDSMVSGIPLYSIGTSLIRGHDREVGSLAWTHDGELATVGDDLTVRCWREERYSARDLRSGGEGEGRRWGCGWADVKPDYDDDDEC